MCVFCVVCVIVAIVRVTANHPESHFGLLSLVVRCDAHSKNFDLLFVG